MEVNFKDLFDILQKIQNGIGLWAGLIFITIVIILIALSIYLKQSIKSAAEESYQKTIEEFKNQLSKSLQTQIGLFFRDESIRNNLLITIGQKSFDKKIEYWQLTQGLYFEYQKNWSFSETTSITEYSNLDDKLNNIRIKIFNESIYIGFELSAKLLRLNSSMREKLRLKKTEFIYSGTNYHAYNDSKLKANLSRQSTIEDKISELLDETEKWIISKLHSDQTIDKFEFTSEQLGKIKEERDKQFDNISK